ncbi:unnamed protein product [Echinostoma caproni]|uniref:V-SNARE coiled-coil homology domain-containing protein n=1 Tax=Echinostoma caproni TaxID=27848 RepID=A0A183AHX4_9TREM|nr:unnamed protein product [Echinostoma caproni]
MFCLDCSHVVRESAEVMNSLSALRKDYELKVDKNVVAPLTRLVDDTRADIDKERRAFKKAVSDAREARDQLERATAQLNQLTGHNNNNTNNGSTINMNGSFSSLDTCTNNSSANSDAVSAAIARCNQAQSALDEKERDLMASKVRFDSFITVLFAFVKHNLKTSFSCAIVSLIRPYANNILQMYA